jgi:hypothetical protein
MESEFNILQPLPGTSLQALVFATAVLIIVVFLAVEVIRGKLRRRWHERRGIRPEITTLRRLCSELEMRGLENVKIPGRRRLPRIEYVLRLPYSVVVIVFGPRDAHGDLQIREGGQVWGWHEFGREHMQLDPPRKLRELAKALQQAHPFVKVRPFYVMPSTVTLPQKGIPKGVIRADAMAEALRAAIWEDKAGPKGNTDLIEKIWNELLETAQPHGTHHTPRHMSPATQPARN